MIAAGGAGGSRGTGNTICSGDQGSRHDGKSGNLEPVHPSLEWVEVVEVPVVVEPGVSTKAFFVSPSQE